MTRWSKQDCAEAAKRIGERAVVQADGCWVWSGNRDRQGYGRIGFLGRRSMLAHRASYQARVGFIPDGITLDHLCRNRACVNPDHLEPVSLSENCKRQAARCSKVSHCPQGHPYSGDNLVIHANGFRRCRACAREALIRHRQKRKAA